MTLTKEGKDWLATYAGSNGCFQPSGISYKDADGVSHTGSTGDVANALYVAHLVGKDDVEIVAGKSYSDFRSANGGNDLTLDDVGWVYGNDGDPGEPQYCITATTTPTVSPTVTPTPTWEPISPDECPPKESGYHCLTIESDPPGAVIYIDGEDTYRLTPETFKIREGIHTIKLTKKDYADYETTVTVYADRTVKYTLTKLTLTPVPPIEIEVRRGELKGYMDFAESRIPRSITVGSTYTYRIRVENPIDGITATYRVTLTFEGVGDVAGKRYTFSSDVSDPVNPGEGKSLYVDVLLPSDALADTRATYILRARLEGWPAAVAAGV